jgi:hypothetical protein
VSGLGVAEGGVETAAASWTMEGEEHGFMLYQPV